MLYITIHRMTYSNGFSEPKLFLKLLIESKYEISIGRSEENIIRTPHVMSMVSRNHGTIIIEDATLGTRMIYRDKTSTYGTYHIPQRDIKRAIHIKDKQIPINSGDILLIKEERENTGIAFMIVLESS